MLRYLDRQDLAALSIQAWAKQDIQVRPTGCLGETTTVRTWRGKLPLEWADTKWKKSSDSENCVPSLVPPMRVGDCSTPLTSCFLELTLDPVRRRGIVDHIAFLRWPARLTHRSDCVSWL